MSGTYDRELKQYKEDGYCVVRGFFSQKDVGEIAAAVGAFIESESAKLTGRDINFTDGQVNSIHALVGSSDGFFSNLLNGEKAKNFAAVFLEDGAVPRASELFAKPAKVGLPSPWHQDNAYWCVDNANGLTIWIALDECDESNGCLTYFKGTHKIGLVPHKPSFAPGSSQMIEDEGLLTRYAKERVAPSLKPGDVLVHHCLILHGSSANKSGKPRRGLTLQYIGKKSGYDAAMKARYEALLAEQIRMREAQAAGRQ